jgi:hypothetical protein
MMILPSQLDDDEVQAVLKKRRAAGAHIILDNGVSEFKVPLESPVLLSLIQEAEPNELVLPDYLGDSVRTVQSVTSTARWFREHGYTGRLMAVPQGSDPTGYLDCIYAYLADPHIDAIGLSKYFPKFTGQPRADLVEAIHTTGLHRRRSVDWHLLGICEPLGTLSELAANHPWLRGIDTCYPVLASMMGINIVLDSNIVTSPDDFFDAAPDAYWPAEGARPFNLADLYRLLQDNLNAFHLACLGHSITGRRQ